MNGIININKPEGITSFGVIREVKRIAGEKKIGHTGTLDPLAKGVLPLFLGKYTKLIPHFNVSDKHYSVTATLGYKSTTIDREGEITTVPIPETCDEQAIRRALSRFQGEINQIPPLYSAIKVNGKRLYEYARKGEEITPEPRKVTLYNVSNLQIDIPEIHFDVFCSKGTYIRSIVRDLGLALGTEAYMTDLIRTKSGDFFNLENAIGLDEIRNLNKSDLQTFLIDPQYLLPNWHIVSTTSDRNSQYISQGRAINVAASDIRRSPERPSTNHALVENRYRKTIAAGRLEFSQDGSALFHPSNVFL